MKGMLVMRTMRNLLWVIVPLGCLLIVGVGAVIYQRTQRSDELPGRVGATVAPSSASAPASPSPEEVFGQVPSDEDLLHLWAKPAMQGDYSTARLYMDENNLQTADWEQQHEGLVGSIRNYHISNVEVRGQTTQAVVRFDLNTTARCLDVQVNNITKRLSVLNPYRNCRDGE